MAYELVYTSAPEGLNRGSSGFCVVACTKGLGPRLIVTLEGLSAYKPLYPHYAPNAWDNPISRTHYIYEANGEQQHILSRICFNGVDHTQRSNKLASHIVLSAREAASAQGGPSSLLLHEELFKDASWTIKAEYFLAQREIPATTVQVQKCVLWESVMGDAGWAGYLAQAYMDSPNKNVYIAYNPEQNKDILPLLHEAMTLLPEELRWKVTFNTYFVNLPAGMRCSWRCCPADSDAMRMARRSPANIIIDITEQQSLTKESELITIARTGIVQKPEEVTTEPEKSEPISEAMEQDRIIHSQRIKQFRGLQNKPTDLNFRQTGSPLNPVSLQCRHENDAERYGEEIPSFWARKKSIIAIAAIVCLLFAAIGGGVCCVSVIKEKQTYLAQHEKYKGFRCVYEDTKKQCDDISGKVSDAKKEQVDKFLLEVEGLESYIDSELEKVKTLLTYQHLFEKKQSADRISADDTPHGLVRKYENLKKELSSLRNRLDKRKKQMEKSIAARNTVQEGNSVQAPAHVIQEKTLPSQIPAVQPEKKEREAVKKQLPVDDSRYLWIKSESLHKAGTSENIDIQIGSVEQNSILLFQIPDKGNDPQKAGTVLQCGEDNWGRSVSIKTTFDNSKGILSFILEGNTRLPEDKGILIVLDQKRKMPLYFRTDISKVKPMQKNKDNLKIQIAEKIHVHIRASAIRIPKVCFTEDNSPRHAVPTLRLRCPSYRNLDLKEGGGYYTYAGADETMKQLFPRVKILSWIKEKIQEDPVSFACAQNLNSSLEKELKDYVDARHAMADNEKLRLKIKKIFDSKAKTAPSADALREEIGTDEGKITQLKAQKLYHWVERYDTMRNAYNSLINKLTVEIKLKDLHLTDPRFKEFSACDKSLSDELKEAQSNLDAREKKIKDAIIGSTVMLVCDKEYEQFPVKDLLQ